MENSVTEFFLIAQEYILWFCGAVGAGVCYLYRRITSNTRDLRQQELEIAVLKEKNSSMDAQFKRLHDGQIELAKKIDDLQTFLREAHKK